MYIGSKACQCCPFDVAMWPLAGGAYVYGTAATQYCALICRHPTTASVSIKERLPHCHGSCNTAAAAQHTWGCTPATPHIPGTPSPHTSTSTPPPAHHHRQALHIRPYPGHNKMVGQRGYSHHTSAPELLPPLCPAQPPYVLNDAGTSTRARDVAAKNTTLMIPPNTHAHMTQHSESHAKSPKHAGSVVAPCCRATHTPCAPLCV